MGSLYYFVNMIKTRDSFSTRRDFRFYKNGVFEDRTFTLKMNLYYFEVNKDILEMMNKFQWKIKGVQIK